MSPEKRVQKIADSILQKALEKGWRIDRFLNKGIKEQWIQRKAEASGLVFPPELVELYAWRNGTQVIEGRAMDDKHFFPGFIFLALDDAIDTYTSISEDYRWMPDWFPVFGNGGGDFYAVICDPSSKDFGAVVGFIVGETEQPLEFESIYTMLETILDCFSGGVYYVSDQGFLEADDLSAVLIAKKHNPNLEIYRSQ